MFDPLLHIDWNSQSLGPDESLSQEWLLTNGLGGYASGTVLGVPTRRYHGLLIAALPAPYGRQVLLNHLSEVVVFADGSSAFLTAKLKHDEEAEIQTSRLKDFGIIDGVPVWRYEINGYLIERSIILIHLQNTVHIRYKLLQGPDGVILNLQPSINFRAHEEKAEHEDLSLQYLMTQMNGRCEIHSKDLKLPLLRLYFEGESNTFTHHSEQFELLYLEEKNRGYSFEGSLWSPGFFNGSLNRTSAVTLRASTEDWEKILALSTEEAFFAERERRMRLLHSADKTLQSDPGKQFVLAADQFVITPAGRVEDSARANAMGEQSRSVIAGYHWFTDWGRDTMISLEGLALLTGRQDEARWILHTFASHIRNGLIPNLFPEGEKEGLYHTADATLWFVHALSRYLEATNDFDFLEILFPSLLEILERHKSGTDFGIGMDSSDKLLTQGAEGYQLTWMDAKVGDWVVTPRRGKAVEINALWYNALKLFEGWSDLKKDLNAARSIRELAEEVYNSFNTRFWNEKQGCLYDVIDGDGEKGKNDPACRPNQIFALSLPYPVLDRKYWEPVLSTVEKELLTPFGLRSLSPQHPDYKSKYFGDLRARDAAYHQGTVWAWLIGPFVDARLRVYPDDQKRARSYLSGFVEHLMQAGIGSISEVFDAEAPFTPRGCIAQAWSIAEVIRAWKNTE